MPIEVFEYTGSVQNWIVPDGVTSIEVTCWGAEGGRKHADAPRRYGGHVQGKLRVTPGQLLRIYVGEHPGIGNVRAGGWNGGGDGGLHLNDIYSPSMDGTGGGGATDIRVGGTELSHRVVVAGGSGGQSSNDPIADPPEGIRRGGHGGADIGERGDGLTDVGGGFGGSQSEGGAIGGALGQGGGGGEGDDPLGPTGSGGGGGGGYYGGGGGGAGVEVMSGTTNGRGGGGGSNYTGPLIAPVSTQGTKGGHGLAVITYKKDEIQILHENFEEPASILIPNDVLNAFEVNTAGSFSGQYGYQRVVTGSNWRSSWSNQAFGWGSHYEAWIRPDDGVVSVNIAGIVLGYPSTTQTAGYQIFVDTRNLSGANSTASFQIRKDTTTAGVAFSEIPLGITAGEWYRIAVDWKLNGDIVASLYDANGVHLSTIVRSDTDYNFGYAGVVAYNNASFDDFKVWTIEENQYLHNISRLSLNSFWRFNETGATAADLIPPLNNASFTGTRTLTDGVPLFWNQTLATQFNGTNNTAQASLSQTAQGALAFWFAPRDAHGGGQWGTRFDLFTSNITSGTGRFLFYRVNADELAFYYHTGTIYNAMRIDCWGWPADEWRHLGVAYACQFTAGPITAGGNLASSFWGLEFETKVRNVPLKSLQVDSGDSGTLTISISKYTPGTGAIGDPLFTQSQTIGTGLRTITLNNCVIEEPGVYIIHQPSGLSMLRTNTGYNYAAETYSTIDFIGAGNSSTGGTNTRWYYFFNIKVGEGENRVYVNGRFHDSQVIPTGMPDTATALHLMSNVSSSNFTAGGLGDVSYWDFYNPEGIIGSYAAGKLKFNRLQTSITSPPAHFAGLPMKNTYFGGNHIKRGLLGENQLYSED